MGNECVRVEIRKADIEEGASRNWAAAKLVEAAVKRDHGVKDAILRGKTLTADGTVLLLPEGAQAFTREYDAGNTNQRRAMRPISFTMRACPSGAITTQVREASTAKEALAVVQDVLNGGGRQAKMLWDVLTALRGPDSRDQNLKERTTARIRYMALGDAPGKDPNGVAISRASPIDASGSDHFCEHAQAAKEALEEMGLTAGAL
jgi:hypothetical protein